MKRSFSVLLMICLSCAIGMAQDKFKEDSKRPDAQSKGKQQPEETRTETPADYVIGPEDVLQVGVYREPDFSLPRVTVRPDGKIGIPFLNDIQAGGLTTKQLEEQVVAGLKEWFTEPRVTILVLESRSKFVYVTGAVAKPGPFPLGAPMTVMELLIRAGGLADFAKSESIQIVRTEGGKTVQYPFNFKRFSDGKDYKQNISLKSGDIVIVK